MQDSRHAVPLMCELCGGEGAAKQSSCRRPCHYFMDMLRCLISCRIIIIRRDSNTTSTLTAVCCEHEEVMPMLTDNPDTN